MWQTFLDKISTLDKVLFGALAVCIIIIMILSAILVFSHQEVITTGTTTTERTETIEKVKYLPGKIIKVAGKATIKYMNFQDTIRTQNDTVYCPVYPEFVAVLDTIIQSQNDTLRAEFSYPQAYFNIILKQSADSIKVKETKIFVNKETVKEKSNILMDYTEKIILFGAGYLIGKSL